MGMAGGTRDLVAATMVVVLLSTLVDGPAAWLVGGLLLGAVILATLQVLGDEVPAAGGLGVPVESLLTPGVAAFGILTSIRLVPTGLLLVPAIGLGALLLARVLRTEMRLLASAGGATASDRAAVRAEALVVGFLVFLGIASLVPGGLPEPGGVVGPLAGPQLTMLAAADAVAALLLGYRAGALRSANARDVAWFALTSATVVAITAVGLRAMEIPRLLGPALLVLVFFLWDAMHATAPTRRRNRRRIAEILLLVLLGVVVAAWSQRLRV